MHSVDIILLLTIISALIFIGFLLNVFIFLKNFTDWLRGRQLQAIDVILASLGLVRIIHLMLYILKTTFFISAEIYHLVRVDFDHYVTTQVFVEFCSLWWGTVLCVFYCLKINNYSSRLFIKLKMRISRMVPWLLLGSMVVSFCSSLPFRWVMYSFCRVNSTHICNGTSTDFVSSYIFIFSGSIVPFIIFCVATFFLVMPLLKHTRSMNNGGSGFTQSQLQVYLNTIRNMLSFLTFFIIYFISGILFQFSVQLQNDLFIFWCCLFQISYPSLHSLVLIISNVKLKQSIIEVLRCLK